MVWRIGLEKLRSQVAGEAVHGDGYLEEDLGWAMVLSSAAFQIGAHTTGAASTDSDRVIASASGASLVK